MTAPILNAAASPTLSAVSEGVTNPAGISVASLVVDGSITDTDGAVEAIVIEALNTTLGAWQFSLDGGSTWLTVMADLINSSTNLLGLALGPTALIRLLPFGELSGILSAAITFRAWDQSDGKASGSYITYAPGTGAVSAASDTASLSVVAVDDAPTFFATVGTGTLVLPMGVNSSASAVVMQPNGKIVVTGYTYDWYTIVRLNADGSRDSGFGLGGSGMVNVDVGPAVVLQPDGKLLVAGSVLGDFAVLRLNADGSVDSSFGTAGKAVPMSTGNDYGYDLVLQTDGKIIVAGYTQDAFDTSFSLARLNANGSLDTSFGNGGKANVAIGPGTASTGQSVTVQADGKILVAGYAGAFGFSEFGVTRLNVNGSLDTSFGVGGTLTIDVDSTDSAAFDVIVQADGKILLAGYARDGIFGSLDEEWDFALVRLTASGSLDTTFGDDGKVTVEMGQAPQAAFGYSLAVQPDGQILLAGSQVDDQYIPGFAVIRLTASGNLDSSFGVDGKTIVPVGSSSSSYSMALQPDGRIVLAGIGSNSFALLRLKADGSLDTSFNSTSSNTLGGVLAYDRGATAIVLDSNVSVFDVELAALNNGTGNYGGATLTLSRNGGASAQDLFSAKPGGTLAALSQGTSLLVDDVTIGLVTTNSAGTLQLTFASVATQALVDSALRQLAYSSTTAPSGQVQINWTFSDGNTGSQGIGANQQATGSVTVNVTATNVNHAPSGSVSISGAATQNQTLAASNTLADADGLGTISYQWKANGANIGTGSTYMLTQAEVGKTITVVASYTDGFGTAESVTSNATGTVANVNDTPTGSVTISGTPTQNQLLTASNTLADADGLGAISYQWKANGSTVGTGSTYTLTQAEVGKTITVVASYTDGLGAAESVSSNTTGVVANINDAPTGIVTISGTPTQNQLLSASNTLADLDGLGIVSYQWKANGSNVGTGSTYTLTQAEVGKTITVVASYSDGLGAAESVSSNTTGVVANINDAPTGIVTISGTPTQNQLLSASNTLADLDGLGIISYQWKANGSTVGSGSTYTLTQAEVGKTITVVASYTDGLGAAESVSSNATGVVANVNHAPTGIVTISGTPTQNQLLSASNTLADLDGLGTISYQWKANGSNVGTGSTYALTQAQVGKTITVVASYTDGLGAAESVSSNATGVVANINDAPTGIVTISGTPTQNQLLSASNTLADLDGLGIISYQWKANGANVGTGSTYALTQAEVGKTITVVASYTDGLGAAESVSSNATGVVANVNHAPTGIVTISGTSTQNQLLSASNTLADLDGLGIISYQWKANGANVGTGSTYTLTQAEVGKTITVMASYTDGLGAAESKTSAPTALVVNVNPTVNSFSPADEATSVAIGSDVVVTFSEPIQRGTGNIFLKTVGGTVIATYDAATSANLSVSGSTLTINPSIDLGYETGYKVEFAAGSIKDLAGSSYAGTTSYNFTTLAASDLTAPTVTFTDNIPGIAKGNVTYTLAFNEAVTGLGANDFSIINGTVSSLSGSGSSYSVVVAPTAGIEGSMSLSLFASAVSDLAGNPNAAAAAGAQPIDTKAPSVISFNPGDDAARVDVSSTLSFSFGEAISKGVGTIAVKTLEGAVLESFDAATSNRLSLSGSTLTIDPISNLAYGTGYKAEFAAGSVQDLAGNPYAGGDSYNFTTTLVNPGDSKSAYYEIAQKFYVAYFGRPADTAGLGNMAQAFAISGAPTTLLAFLDSYNTNATVRDIVNSFGLSAESQALYGSTSTAARLTAVYHYLFNRDPDAEGLVFWAGGINSGNLSLAQAALRIMQGAENHPLEDGLTIVKKITVAQNFTSALDTPTESNSYAGNAAAAAVRTMLGGVGQTTDTGVYEASVLATINQLMHPSSVVGFQYVDFRPDTQSIDNEPIALVGVSEPMMM